MSDSTGITPGTEALAEFNATFAEYLRWTSKEQGEAIEHRGLQVRIALYKQFRALAKTPEQLKAEIAGLGYAVKRRPLSKEDVAANRSAYGLGGGKLAWGDTVVSTDEEIRLRVKSLRYLSVSFLYKAWKAARGQRGQFMALNAAHKQIGVALVRTEKGNESPFVMLTSFLQGVVAENRQRGIADRVLRAQSAEMVEYVRRKHQEYLQRVFNRTYGVALGAAGV